MALFSWGDELSVKIPSIDEQHKKLVGLVNDVHEVAVSEKDKNELENVFNDLVEYTQSHFIYEENIFEKYGYPKMAEHIQQHEALKRKVNGFLADFKTGNMDMLEFLAFMVDWLQDHIMNEDMAYSHFLIQKGVK
ncbi:MAG: bacteriohemerythrin [Spirochaetota bacterium]